MYYFCATMIHADITVEDLIELLPEAVGILQKFGLVCIICGEPVWGTLKELASARKIGNEVLESIIIELNQKYTDHQRNSNR